MVEYTYIRLSIVFKNIQYSFLLCIRKVFFFSESIDLHMTLNELTYPSPRNRTGTDASSMADYPPPSFRNSPVSMNLPLPPDVSPIVSSIVQTKRTESTGNQSEYPSVPTQKHPPIKQISQSHLRHRLCVRERFLARL